MIPDCFSLQGKNALVTGSRAGLGAAMAIGLAQAGANVVVNGSREDGIQDVCDAVAACGVQAVRAVANVSDPRACADLVDLTVRELGSIDILINNAGISGGNGLAWELDPLMWRRVIEVNLVGPYLTCRCVVPIMLQRGYGRIVNVASIAGKEGNPNASHYSASKAGLIGFTKSLAKELATRNILVNCVTPAAAKTEIFAQMKQEHIDYMLSRIPMSRFAEPQEIAATICWLASEDCSFATGAVFDISGGRATY